MPLNYSDPDGREAAIALIRKPSVFKEGSAFYRGPVLINPGGPGGSGVDMVMRSGNTLSTILGPQFDIVGFDPRGKQPIITQTMVLYVLDNSPGSGISRSIPRVSFFKTDVERALWGQLQGNNLLNASESGIGRVWARSHVVGQLAAETDDGYLRHINTENTAHDMLRIVEAHGRDKLQYWGFS